MKKITGNKHLEPIDQNSYAAWTEERGKAKENAVAPNEVRKAIHSTVTYYQYCNLLQMPITTL